MKAMTLVLLLAMLCGGADARNGEHYRSASIYLYGWDLRLRVSLSLEDVRRRSSTTAAINSPDNATEFAKSLRLGSMVPRTNEAGKDDPRFVIDLVRSDGARETYYATDFYLFSEDGARLRPIDCHFHRRFELMPAEDCP